MRQLYRYGLWLMLVFTSSAMSHSTLIATYQIQQLDSESWALAINVPLYPLHKALLQRYQESELWLDDGKYNQALLLEYLDKGSQIQINGSNEVVLSSSKVILDDHQSRFEFVMHGMPENVDLFDFQISVLSENPGHTNIVRVKSGQKNRLVVLKQQNQYSAKLAL